MSIELITVAAGIIITWLLFTWVIKVLKASISTAFTIAIILLCLQIFFGIKYQQVWVELNNLVQDILGNQSN